MNATATLRARFHPSSLTAVLAIGDLAMIGAFVVGGEVTHGFDPIADAERVIGTVVPFLVGWALASLAAGVYARGAVSDFRCAVGRTLPAWAAAVLVAQLLRATAVFPGDAALTFALVSLGVGGALVTLWRVVATLATDRWPGRSEATENRPSGGEGRGGHG